jgi:hypothetical protein
MSKRKPVLKGSLLCATLCYTLELNKVKACYFRWRTFGRDLVDGWLEGSRAGAIVVRFGNLFRKLCRAANRIPRCSH